MVVTIRLDAPLRLLVPAKLNLGLEVVGRRADGLHEVVTILQAIDLTDVITLAPAVTLEYVPLQGEQKASDLLARALALARDRLGIDLGAAVRLEKRIPLAAGLGGGSSDAGTLLGALAGLAGLPLEEAERAAAELGSDVPFFVRGGTALATGSGTALAPLPAPSRLWIVIAVPELRLPDKTRRLYGALSPTDYSDGAATLAQAARLCRGLPLDPALLRNAFARPLLEYEPVRAVEAALRSAGAELVVPSGAGPTLFAPFSDREAAFKTAEHLRGHVPQVFVCVPVGPGIQQTSVSQPSRTDSE